VAAAWNLVFLGQHIANECRPAVRLIFAARQFVTKVREGRWWRDGILRQNLHTCGNNEEIVLFQAVRVRALSKAAISFLRLKAFSAHL